MAPLHMYLLRDLLHRLRVGESQRRIARDLGLARETVDKYRRLAAEQGLLSPDRPLPKEIVLQTFSSTSAATSDPFHRRALSRPDRDPSGARRGDGGHPGKPVSRLSTEGTLLLRKDSR